MSAWTWLFSDLSNECPYLRTNLRIYPHTQLLKQSNATNLRQTKLSTQLKYQLTALLFAHFLPEFTRVKWCGWFIIFTVRSTLLRPGINHGPVFEQKQRARRKKIIPAICRPVRATAGLLYGRSAGTYGLVLSELQLALKMENAHSN